MDSAFRVSGTIIDIPVKANQSVAKGQLLARLDPRDFETRLAQVSSAVAEARARLAAMQAGDRPEDIRILESQLAAERARLSEAELEFTRTRNLLERGAATKDAFDRATRALEVARASTSAAASALARGRAGARVEDIEGQLATVRRLEAQQREARDALEDTRLTAPFAGIVARTTAETFQEVQARQPIVSLRDATGLEIVTDVPESVVLQLSAGQVKGLVAVFDSLPGRSFPVTYAEAEGEADPRTRTFAVVFNMPAAPQGIRILPGMTATIRVETADATAARPDEWPIPAAAVFAGADGKRYVWRVDARHPDRPAGGGDGRRCSGRSGHRARRSRRGRDDRHGRRPSPPGGAEDPSPSPGGVEDPVNPAAIALRHKTSTLVFVVLIVVGGYLSYRGLSRLEDPEFTIKDALVMTAYPGATAREVEEEVTDVVETAVKELGQIKHVESTSSPGRSIVTVTIKAQYDKRTLPQVWDELRRKVNDAQGRLPPGAGPSLVLDDFGDVFGIFLALSGDGFSYAELRDAARLLQRELRLVPDVSKVTLSGLQRETIYVEISRARLASLGVPESKIYAALAGKNLVGPSGAVEVGRERIRILPEPGLETVKSIGDVVIEGVGSGRQLFVRDVATITRGFEDPPANIIRLNGEPAVGLGISVISGGNVVIMGEAVTRRIAELKSRLPVGLELGTIYFQPDIVVRAIDGFIVTLAEAVVIVIGVLVISMGVRSGLLIGASLLLTILSTFIAMSMYGVALERISLGAMVIALSMMVDNAVVISEGMLIGVQQGGNAEEVAGEAVARTMWPLLGGTAIAVLAFAAIGLSQDATGEYCFSLFLVILFAIGTELGHRGDGDPGARGHDPQGQAAGPRTRIPTRTCSTAATGACSRGACASAGPPSP